MRAALLSFLVVLSTAPLATRVDAESAPSPVVAVAPQYGTTHVYVGPEDGDRFVASFLATFGGRLRLPNAGAEPIGNRIVELPEDEEIVLPILKGLGGGPPIAGRHANYIVRQLYFFQDGSRSGPSAALMQGVVQNIGVDDMVALRRLPRTVIVNGARTNLQRRHKGAVRCACWMER
jgi:hypothetical protein